MSQSQFPPTTVPASASTPAPASEIQLSSKATLASPSNSEEAASKLAEALDDFLGDVERKFKGISEEILARLDEMAERCDRLQGELLAKDAGRSSVEEGEDTS